MNPELQRFKEIITKNNCFITKQRLELFKYLQSSPAIAINKLISSLKDQDQATIYRNIKLFEHLGVISRLQLGWKSKLELTSAFIEHHHHMSCTSCGTVTTWEEDPALELRIQTLALKLGFIPTDHQLEIRGLCKTCQTKRPQPT